MPYTNACDAEGTDICPASVGRRDGLRGTAQLVESTVISIASALRPMGPHANVVIAFGGGSGKAKAIKHAVPRETKVKSGRPLKRIFIDPTGPYPPSRAPFVGEVPTWGGGAVVDASAVASAAAPAAATVTGSGVFPAASARRAADAPASAAVAALRRRGGRPVRLRL